MPLDSILAKGTGKILALLSADIAPGMFAFETQQVKDNAPLNQFSEIGNYLALPKGIKHAIVRNVQNSPALKPHSSHRLTEHLSQACPSRAIARLQSTRRRRVLPE